jgi:hypothetical protein
LSRSEAGSSCSDYRRQWNIIANDDGRRTLCWPEPNLVRGGVSFFLYLDLCPDGYLRNTHYSIKHEE